MTELLDTNPKSHGAHDSHDDIQHHVKRYLFVFYALIVGTVVTVAASRLHIDSVALTVAIALFIACIKGFLVAGYFMHLISEKKMIYGILLATGFFFTGLMFLTIWSMHPSSLIHMRQ
ncbi:MAG TPA: cytochrome C oxidase subunit IV family protein [Verrucomicrobiae bacterium]|jgi:caa(3)-type oxidase subunit IV|nr:cytochrome C oxidase subunit IV family protein [Verrucomicrobiae bacterium]